MGTKRFPRACIDRSGHVWLKKEFNYIFVRPCLFYNSSYTCKTFLIYHSDIRDQSLLGFIFLSHLHRQYSFSFLSNDYWLNKHEPMVIRFFFLISFHFSVDYGVIYIVLKDERKSYIAKIVFVVPCRIWWKKQCCLIWHVTVRYFVCYSSL